MASRNGLAAPHRLVNAADARERFALELLDTLWHRYRKRVVHVQTYERIVSAAGGTFVNDHIAFRSLALQKPQAGIASIARLFEALGYKAAANYNFEDKKIGSIHYQHRNPGFPKLFISELKTWELSRNNQRRISRIAASHRMAPSLEFLAALRGVKKAAAATRKRLLSSAARFFSDLPWDLPQMKDIAALDRESQFAAWVAVHGYDVNHFTVSVNSQGVDSLSDIKKTVAALKKAGVPMKDSIEGAPGSKLRQSATQAAVIDVPVRDGRRKTTMPWTYAYFELAERGEVTDPITGRRSRFEGFLGPQATHLFEMTRRR